MSDWSSDVCSSDLHRSLNLLQIFRHRGIRVMSGKGAVDGTVEEDVLSGQPSAKLCRNLTRCTVSGIPRDSQRPAAGIVGNETVDVGIGDRSEERRGGKAWCSTCRARWLPEH